MNAYLFTASTTQSQVRRVPLGQTQTADRLQTWDSCASLIVCADNPDLAQKRFEQWLGTPPDNGNPIEFQINKLVAAELVNQVLTETGSVPIDWPTITAQAQSVLDATPVDDFEQGYWVDVNDAVPARQLSFNVDALRQNLPEDIRSGLNWSADKQFFFLLSVLSPLPPPAEPVYDPEPDAHGNNEARDETENAGAAYLAGIGQTAMDYPELVDKEAAALIRARNSVVAAWLWRKFAATTPLTGNAIRIDPWCGILPEPSATP